MPGDGLRRTAAALSGASAAAALLVVGARAIGPGPVRFEAPGPYDAGLASTALRVDRITLVPATADGNTSRLDLLITNVGRRDAIGVGYVLEDQGVVVDYAEAPVVLAGRRDSRHLSWIPQGHGLHSLRIVVGDGNVHWVRTELRTGVFEDSTLGARRHRSAGSLVLGALAGALVAVNGRRLWPHVRMSPIEVVPDPVADLVRS